MRKTWIQVHLHQGALFWTGTLLSAHSHTQGEFHRTSNNWRWKVPIWWHFHASITMLRQPHVWKLPRMYTPRIVIPTSQTNWRRVKCKAIDSQDSVITSTQISLVIRRVYPEIFTTTGTTRKHYPPISKWTLTWTLTIWPPYQWHTKKYTFFQDHWRQWHTDTDTQRKKPTFFQDHQNSNRLMPQKLRSSTQVRQPRQEYSRFTETEKAKFQTPFIYNDDRNFVRHNSVEKFSPHLVYLTKSDTSSDSIF